MPRATSVHLDSIIDREFSVLDHGFVRLVDYMGNETSVVRAARLSYNKTRDKEDDGRGLIRYLMRNRHSSPLEMCEIKLHLKMPIFVARQWIRHRTASLNEMSGRYSVLPSEFYLPDADDLGVQSTTNKQGTAAGGLTDDQREMVRFLLQSRAEVEFETYEALLETGLSRELARIHLPLSTYTEFVWKIDLHNLLHFLRLRLDSHAQREIRVYADVIADMVAGWVPMIWEAFGDYQLHARTFSLLEMEMLRNLIGTGDIGKVDDRFYDIAGTLTKSEKDSFCQAIGFRIEEMFFDGK